MTEAAYCGIDVACAKRKRLPINVSVVREGRLEPLPLRDRQLPLPPRGEGNLRTLDQVWLTTYSAAVAAYLRVIERHFDIRIARIAIDAPSDPRSPDIPRRLAEVDLDSAAISCFTTPSVDDLRQISTKVRAHVEAGGAETNLPHANQLWMLVGFSLFARLRQDWECIEVYPQATAAILGAARVHKSSLHGIVEQLSAAREHTGWPIGKPLDLKSLRRGGYGALHDCLDTYLAAWVASLNEDERKFFGRPPTDAIWVPKIALPEKITNMDKD